MIGVIVTRTFQTLKRIEGKNSTAMSF